MIMNEGLHSDYAIFFLKCSMYHILGYLKNYSAYKAAVLIFFLYTYLSLCKVILTLACGYQG